jgi:peptidyl-prolyl cis-trans isomerase SurA
MRIIHLTGLAFLTFASAATAHEVVIAEQNGSGAIVYAEDVDSSLRLRSVAPSESHILFRFDVNGNAIVDPMNDLTYNYVASSKPMPRAGASSFSQPAVRPGEPIPYVPEPVGQATIIVNGTLITRTDVDNRIAWWSIGGLIRPEEHEGARSTALRNARARVVRDLIDEVLQIQEGQAQGIRVSLAEVDQYFAIYAAQSRRTPEQYSAYLQENKSSPGTVKQMILSQLFWRRLLHSTAVAKPANEEVAEVMTHLSTFGRTYEFRVSEIFLPTTPQTAAQVLSDAGPLVEQLRGGASFASYAQQHSKALTAPKGGDLGWGRTEQLPRAASAAIDTMAMGAVSDPIPGKYGVFIVRLTDVRQFVVPSDPNNAIFSVKTIVADLAGLGSSEDFDGTLNIFRMKYAAFQNARKSIRGCATAEAAAATIGAVVKTEEPFELLPGASDLKYELLKLSPGQTTTPFGSPSSGVVMLVLCGRDDPEPAKSIAVDATRPRLAEDPISLRARRYLSNLRQDAFIEER